MDEKRDHIISKSIYVTCINLHVVTFFFLLISRTVTKFDFMHKEIDCGDRPTSKRCIFQVIMEWLYLNGDKNK